MIRHGRQSLLGVSLLLVACQAPVADAPCPCGEGYTCCAASQTCVVPDECPLPGADPDGTRSRFVVSALGARFGEEPGIRNRLGARLVTPTSFGLVTALHASVPRGDAIILLDVQATDLAAAEGVVVRMLEGASPVPTPCLDPADLSSCSQHLLGDGSFEIARSSPTDTSIAGRIEGGIFTADPSDRIAHGTVRFPIDVGGGPLPLDLALLDLTIRVKEEWRRWRHGVLEVAVRHDQLLPLDVMGDLAVEPDLDLYVDATGERGRDGVAESISLALDVTLNLAAFDLPE